MSFDAGSIIARAEVDKSQFKRDLAEMEADARRFEEARHSIRFRATMEDSDLTRARTQFARFDQQLYNDAVQRQRSGRGILAGLFGRAVGGAAGATLFGGLVGAGGAAASAGTESAIRSEMTRLDSQLSRDAVARAGGSGGGGSPGLLSSLAGGGFFSKLLRGIGPSIGPVGLRAAGIIGLGGSALGALPALVGGLGAVGIGGLGAGVIGLGAKTLIGSQQNPGVLYNQAQQADKALKTGLDSAAGGLEGPLKRVLGEVPQLLKGIAGPLKQLFSSAGTLISPFVHGLADLAHEVLPGLAQSFRIVAPLMRPFLDGVGSLVKGLLPGLNSLLRAVRPALTVLEQILGMIGRQLGSMFKDFAPVMKQSAVILKALLAVVTALFPIIGKLAAIFATALAPVFKVFAQTIRDLLPVLTIIGRIIAELAAAILGDLGAAFGALGSLLQQITPSLNILASVLGKVFQTLENSGVFAILGDGLEGVVKPLAKLINALVVGLAPILPSLIGLISSLAGDAIHLLVTALQVLLPIATELVNDALKPLLPAIRALVPVIAIMGSLLATGLGAILKTIAPLLATLAPYILAVVTAIKLWAIAQGILDIALDANPIGLIALAIVALIIGITALATHWHEVWTNIKNWAVDAWQFIDNEVIHPLVRAFEDVQTFLEVWVDRISIVFAGWASNILHYAQDAFGWLPDWLPGAKTIKTGLANAQSDLQDFVSNTQANLAKLTDKSYDLKFVVKLPPGAVTDTKGAKSGGAPTRPQFAKGTKGAPPGWAWTGEEGPELVHFSGGEAVMTHSQSMAVSRGFAGGTGLLTVGIDTPSVNAIGRTFGSIVGNAVSAVQSQYVVPVSMLSTASGHTSVGSGVQRWAGLVLQVLSMLGQPSSDLGTVLAQMTTESGGNPYAINLTDSNAAAGDPSRGLMQTIMTTFLAYAGPFVSRGIYNPLANIYAGLNYAIHRYGSGWTSVLGHGHGYDGGGWLLPGVTTAINQTGMREAVITPAQSQAFTALARYAEGSMQGGGHSGGKRQIAEVINLMLPEGTTVAQAMQELYFRLQVSEMQGFAGAVP
jgi:SLT domain-containing protein